MSESLPRVFVIGSSTTVLFDPYLRAMLAGTFDYARKGDEAGAMAQALADLDHPRGASAGDSAMVVAYLRALERAGDFHADIVLMHVGLHDIKRDPATNRNRVSLADYRANCETIARWFVDRNIRLIWLRGGPLDETIHNARSGAFKRYEADHAAYTAAAEAVMAAHGVEVLDLAGFTRSLAPPEELFKDHIHLHDPYVRQQAAFVAGFLVGALA